MLGPSDYISNKEAHLTDAGTELCNVARNAVKQRYKSAHVFYVDRLTRWSEQFKKCDTDQARRQDPDRSRVSALSHAELGRRALLWLQRDLDDQQRLVNTFEWMSSFTASTEQERDEAAAHLAECMDKISVARQKCLIDLPQAEERVKEIMDSHQSSHPELLAWVSENTSWKDLQEQLHEHYADIMTATEFSNDDIYRAWTSEGELREGKTKVNNNKKKKKTKTKNRRAAKGGQDEDTVAHHTESQGTVSLHHGTRSEARRLTDAIGGIASDTETVRPNSYVRQVTDHGGSTGNHSMRSIEDPDVASEEKWETVGRVRKGKGRETSTPGVRYGHQTSIMSGRTLDHDSSDQNRRDHWHAHGTLPGVVLWRDERNVKQKRMYHERQEREAERAATKTRMQTEEQEKQGDSTEGFVDAASTILPAPDNSRDNDEVKALEDDSASSYDPEVMSNAQNTEPVLDESRTRAPMVDQPTHIRQSALNPRAPEWHLPTQASVVITPCQGPPGYWSDPGMYDWPTSDYPSSMPNNEAPASESFTGANHFSEDYSYYAQHQGGVHYPKRPTKEDLAAQYGLSMRNHDAYRRLLDGFLAEAAKCSLGATKDHEAYRRLSNEFFADVEKMAGEEYASMSLAGKVAWAAENIKAVAADISHVEIGMVRHRQANARYWPPHLNSTYYGETEMLLPSTLEENNGYHGNIDSQYSNGF